MSNDNVPPAMQRRPLREDRRLTDIERRRIITPTTAEISGGDRFPGFSFPAFALADLAPSWYTTRDISYVAARISARIAGGGTGSFRLDVNGTPVITLSLLTGELTHVYVALFSIAAGSRLDGEVTAAAGQFIVSVQLEEAA